MINHSILEFVAVVLVCKFFFIKKDKRVNDSIDRNMFFFCFFTSYIYFHSLFQLFDIVHDHDSN